MTGAMMNGSARREISGFLNSSFRNVTPDAASLLGDDDASRGPITWDDATWILTSAFIIFTMQSGFGMLEAGCVSSKNEVNIMVKNAVDVIFGGLSYWMFGYALSFGDSEWSNPFCGFGDFFVDSSNPADMGITYSNFVFQLSFATTATTIVSGAMAERTKLPPYIIFSFLNTIGYCIPAHWIWDPTGFLHVMGAIDIAGSGAVHLLGGTAALVAALTLKPRKGRYEKGNSAPLTNQTNCMLGMFMLWWGWLGFNCGSTFGISGGKWKLAAKSAVTTLIASMGGGTVGAIFSYVTNKGKLYIRDLVNSILGALVSITGGCAVIRTWESVLVGMLGGFLAVSGSRLLERLKIDDPVAALPVHGFAGIWGMLAIGLLAEIDPLEDLTRGQAGLLKGGSARLLGVQSLACVCIIAWSAVTSYIVLYLLKITIGLRMSEEDERLGADFVEHGIPNIAVMTETSFGGAYLRRSFFGMKRLEPTFNSSRASENNDQENDTSNDNMLKAKTALHMLEEKPLPIINKQVDDIVSTNAVTRSNSVNKQPGDDYNVSNNTVTMGNSVKKLPGDDHNVSTNTVASGNNVRRCCYRIKTEESTCQTISHIVENMDRSTDLECNHLDQQKKELSDNSFKQNECLSGGFMSERMI